MTIVPFSTLSLREIDFLSSTFNDVKGAVIPAKVFNAILKRRANKINEFKEINNLSSKELIFCDFLRDSLDSMQVLVNSSSRSVQIVVRSNLVYSYKDIVASFYSVFNNERTSSVDYAPVVRRATSPIDYEPPSNFCGCYPLENRSPEMKIVYPKSKMLMLIDEYKSDFDLYVDYKTDQKPYLSSFIEQLETLKLQISNATELDNDLDEYNRKKANLEAFKVINTQFEFIVEMFLYQTTRIKSNLDSNSFRFSH